MLAQIKNIFSPAAVASSISALPILETGIMDALFTERPLHPLSMIALSELTSSLQTVPVVRREGMPIGLQGDEATSQFIAPLPLKVQVNISAAELNDLRLFMGNSAALDAWRSAKIDQIRRTARQTTEAMCAIVLSTGKLSWPIRLEGGRTEQYEIDYGAPLRLDSTLASNAKLKDVYVLLRSMEQQLRRAGMGGRVEFWAGADMVSLLIDLVQALSTSEKSLIHAELDSGLVRVGAYTVHLMDESYPDPLTGDWLPKIDPKTLLGVATDSIGKVFYCATDSISNQNAAVPLHIIPVPRADDSGVTLIGQSKPLPVRSPKSVCVCKALA